jgi:hypothetical protein
MIKAVEESTLAARLHKAGMRLERRGDHFEVYSGNQIVLSRGPDNRPLTLKEIDDMTRHLSQIDPVDATSRRRFLSTAAGVAAGGAVLALAAIPPTSALAAPAGLADPVFGMIAAHREAVATVRDIEAEATRQADLGTYVETEANDITEPASAELGLFVELTEAVPTTLAGVVALVTYLDEINEQDPWKFEDNNATPLIGALATAFSRMAVAS